MAVTRGRGQGGRGRTAGRPRARQTQAPRAVPAAQPQAQAAAQPPVQGGGGAGAVAAQLPAQGQWAVAAQPPAQVAAAGAAGVPPRAPGVAFALPPQPPAAIRPPAGIPWMDQAAVEHCLGLCGLRTAEQRTSWVEQGIDEMQAFSGFAVSDVQYIGTKIEKQSRGAALYRQPYAALMRIAGLVQWCKERQSLGLLPDANEFTRDVMYEMAQQGLDEKEGDGDKKLNTDAPEIGKFSNDKWVQWKLGFWEQMSQEKSQNNVPLSYVIRPRTPKTPEELAQMDPKTQRVYLVQHSGNKYVKDNKLLFSILKRHLLKTSGWTWIQGFDSRQDGRGAWLALEDHCDGPQATATRIATAESTLKNLYYKNENTGVNFASYAKKMLEALTTLEDNGRYKGQAEWVAYLLQGIDNTAPQYVLNAKSNILIQKELKEDFCKAANVIAEHIAIWNLTKPSSRPGQGGGRRISGIERGRGGGGRGNGGGRCRGRGGRGRGRGRGGQGGNSQNNINGVDVTNPGRTFTNDEYRILYDAGYLDTLKQRHTQQRGGGRGSGSDGSVSVASLQLENEVLTARIAALEGIMNAEESNQQNDNSTIGTKRTRDSNGNSFGTGAYTSGGGRQRNG